jgi:Rps23 Pro-64 3,4-dihydroxylase Tpa1-like proline 4-hydroxylase
MVDYKSFTEKGYYCGHVSEIFSDMSIFYNFAEETKKLTATKSNDKCHYINDIIGQHGVYHREVSIDEFDNRQQLIKNNSLVVDQQWWNYSLQGTVEPDTYFLFRNEISKYMVSIYNHVGLTIDNVAHGDNITLYEDGDFSRMHKDGQNIGRHAVILIYFGEDYNDAGGEFVFGTNDKIAPISGNFVMLDFTKNNPPHGVEVVKNGFKRITYIDFVANIDMQ